MCTNIFIIFCLCIYFLIGIEYLKIFFPCISDVVCYYWFIIVCFAVVLDFRAEFNHPHVHHTHTITTTSSVVVYCSYFQRWTQQHNTARARPSIKGEHALVGSSSATYHHNRPHTNAPTWCSRNLLYKISNTVQPGGVYKQRRAAVPLVLRLWVKRKSTSSRF